MKNTSLLLAAVVLLAGASSFAQPVVARGQVQLVDGGGVLCKPALVPIDLAARAGDAGTVLFYNDCSRMQLAPGSQFAVFGGIPVRPAFDTPIDYPDATSAIKSINTRRNTLRFRNEAEQVVTHDGLVVRSGRLLVDQRASAVDIRALKATVNGVNSRFSVAFLSPCSARVTVAEGLVTVRLPGETPRTVHCGEFMLLASDATGRTFAYEPRLISDSALARADQADLFADMASRLAPVGECVDLAGDLEPVSELVGVLPTGITGIPSVGTGPSVPFDLPAILTPASVPSVTGPVVSPAAP